jgi:ADP-heptose:LPS heptosyltransferase
VLEGFDAVDNVITVGKDVSSRMKTAWQLRRRDYDVAFNLHGGTTGTFFTFASGARHRVGYAEYQYPFLYNHLLSSSSDFWQRKITHSAEQQLALLGFVGVPVKDTPKSKLIVTPNADESIKKKLPHGDFVLIHPVAAFATKTWALENFARTVEFLAGMGLPAIAIATKKERDVLERLKHESESPLAIIDDLSLPEITALAARARLFVGNDSGIAHMAAAVNTPSVVIFGSSNRDNWHPWTDAPYEIVFEPFPCQPCPGYECKVFGEPKCILSVRPERVFEAIENVIEKSSSRKVPG